MASYYQKDLDRYRYSHRCGGRSSFLTSPAPVLSGLALLASGLYSTTTATICEGEFVEGNSMLSLVDEDDIQDLVDEIMSDPALNLSFIPDALERRIYKSTIQLTLNAFYSLWKKIPDLSDQGRTDKE
jgi:hypothetical protein